MLTPGWTVIAPLELLLPPLVPPSIVKFVMVAFAAVETLIKINPLPVYLSTADCGGSNGYVDHTWLLSRFVNSSEVDLLYVPARKYVVKTELARIADCAFSIVRKGDASVPGLVSSPVVET